MIEITKDIFLEPFRKKHLSETYRSWFSDENVTKYNSHGSHFYSDEDFDEFVLSSQSDKCVTFAIIHRELGHVGNAAIQNIHQINRNAELAFIIGDHRLHGKGIGTGICQYLIRHSFDKLNLSKVYFGTVESNVGMRAIGTKCGFEEEGFLKDQVFLNGTYHNIVLYGLANKR